MKRVVIIGAGGHACEIADVLRHQPDGEISLLGCVIDEPGTAAQTISGLPVLGNWSWFEDADRNELFVICAVGSPEVRKRLVERAAKLHLRFITAISPQAHVSPDARLGEGVMIFPFSFVSAASSIGDHAIVNVGATVSHQSIVAGYGTLSPGVHVAGNVTIGEGCYLGIGASVIQGVTIGPWSTIGAGSVVIKDVDENVTVVGVPAEVIKARTKVSNE